MRTRAPGSGSHRETKNTSSPRPSRRRWVIAFGCTGSLRTHSQVSTSKRIGLGRDDAGTDARVSPIADTRTGGYADGLRRALAAIVFLLALTGCSGPQGPSGTEIPSVVGMTGNKAQDALRDAGFKVEWDAGEDDVWMASNWTVDGQDPAAGELAADGATITLAV